MNDRKNIDLNNKNDFEALFREFFKALSWYAYRFVKDQDAAKEIVHLVFVHLWEKRGEINTSTSLRPWLFTSVHNRCINYIRDHAKFHEQDVSDIPHLQNRTFDNPSNMESVELELHIQEAIDGLPDRCAQIFRLNRFDGKKYSEIAKELNISVKTVEAQMSKALKILRDKLKDYINVLVLWILWFF